MQLNQTLFTALALSLAVWTVSALGAEQSPTTDVGRGNVEAQQGATDSEKNNPEPPPPQGPVGQSLQPRQTQPPQIADVLESRGILTPRDILVIEPQFQYSNSEVTQVTMEGFTILPALLVGLLNIESVRHDTVTTALGMRYGVTSHFELEARIPYVNRNDQISSRPLNIGTEEETITEVSGAGLGDIEMAAHYQFNDGDSGWPYLISNLRIKSNTGEGPFDVPLDSNGLQRELPTGTGFLGIQPSLTFTQPSDPAVFYGSVSYLWSLERDESIAGRSVTLSPGDVLGASLGMGLALNEDASFSLGYSHYTVQPTSQDGKTVKGSVRLQVGVLQIGLSGRVNRHTTVTFGLGVGVTQDAPNAQVTLSLPFNIAPRG